jgi:hypothetical protein
MLAVFLGMTAQPQPVASQDRLLDRAILLVSRGANVIGREEFTLHRGQPSETGAGFLGTGYTVSAAAYYPSSRSYASAASIVQFSSDSQPSSARLDLDGSGQPTTFVDFTVRRITVRNRTSAGESAGQYPRSERVLLVDDSFLSVFILLPGAASGSVTLFYPRTGRSSQAPLEDHGTEATMVANDERQLKHFTLGAGALLRHLWYDSRGRLIKIEIPSDDLTAIRSSRN